MDSLSLKQLYEKAFSLASLAIEEENRWNATNNSLHREVASFYYLEAIELFLQIAKSKQPSRKTKSLIEYSYDSYAFCSDALFQSLIKIPLLVFEQMDY